MPAAAAIPSIVLFLELQPFKNFRTNSKLPDGIEPSSLKGMTTRQAPQPHPDASRRTVALDGLAHVLRTGRIEAARRWQNRRHIPFVYAQTLHNDPLQRRTSRSISLRISVAADRK